jgi:RNA polymerase primary sigma factor
MKTNEELVADKDFNQLLKNNLRYIHTVASSLNQDEYFEDLVQHGRIALHKAMGLYNPSKGIPFIKYAGGQIRFEMLKFLSENARIIRLPANILNSDKKNGIQRPGVISYNQPINEDGDELIDMLFVDDTDHQTDKINTLLTMLNKLPEKQQKLLKMRYGIGQDEPMTLEQIATEYNISREAIRQSINKALESLKNYFPKK